MFLSSIRADAGMDRSPWGDWFFRPVGTFTRSGVQVSSANVLGLPTALACVQVLAKSFALLPPVLFRPKKNGRGRDRLTKHWLYRLLAKRPNGFQSPFEWRMMMEAHLALRGNAYNVIVANGRGEITDLLPRHPDRMTLEFVESGYRYRYRDGSGESIYYAPSEIWHLRWLSDDGMMGMSIVSVAAAALGEGLSIQDYSSRFFANDAKPGGGWIEYPGQFSTTGAKKTFRESWQEMQGGGNRGKVAVLERGMKFHELGLTNKDSQFIEAKQYKGKEIAAIFGVPPHKVGILDEATFSNIEQQALEFWQDTMLPICELWESSIETFLLGVDGPDSDIEVEFDMSRMLRGDSATRALRIATLVNVGVLTRNEGREEEGLDAIDGLDEPLRPLNMIEEGEDPPQGTAPALPAPKKKTKPAAEDDEEPTKKKTNDDAEARRAADVRDRLVAGRMNSLLSSNARRVARRFAAAKATPADVLADAFAIGTERAQQWIDERTGDESEDQLFASLMTLGASA